MRLMSMVNKSRQLNLDELRRLKWLLGGAMALVSLWTVFFLDIEALSLVGVTSAIILAVLIWPELPGKLPALIWKLAVPAIILAAAVDFYVSPDTLPVFIRLAILLVLFRSVSYRRKREDLQLIVLGLFLIVVAGVLTVSLGFAFLLLLFTACALGFLFVINLIDAVETGGARPSEVGTAWTRLSGKAFFARLKSVADWRLLTFAAVLFVTVVAMSGLLFLVIPRFELASGFFLDRYITRKSRTGFTEVVKFGSVSELIKDDSVAMRVDLTDASGLREVPYWRMVALDEYTPEGFRVSAQLKGQLLGAQRVTQTVRGRVTPIKRGTMVGGQWTIYLEPGVSRFLPLPGSFGSLRLREQAQVQSTIAQGREPGRLAWVEGMRMVALRTEAMAMTAFQLDNVEMAGSIPDPNFARLLRGWVHGGEDVRDGRNYDARIMLEGPAGAANEAALKAMVAEITGGAGLSAEEFARRAIAWVQRRHAYALSVQSPAGSGKDDIVRWLESNEPGFCEYFAAGFTVLARAAGHPARVIAGFHGGVLNTFENYYMVKNSHAHAWAEIYDGSTVWLRIDPTPGAGTSGAAATLESLTAQQERDGSWSARFDSLRVLWYRRIVNFDSRVQVQMLDQVKTFTMDSSTAVRARFEEWSKQLKAWRSRPWDMARAGKTAGGGVGAAAVAWLMVRLVRWSWGRWRGWLRPQQFDPVRREAGRQLTRLRVLRKFPEGGRIAGSINAAKIDEGASTLAVVVADLERIRYGRRETWPDARGVFRRAKQVRRSVD